jgi:hypothetical protein
VNKDTSDGDFSTKTMWVLAVALVFYALRLVEVASGKLFWYDEIFTLSIASLPLGAPMWEAMTAGYEFNPPAGYVLVNLVEALLGRGPVVTRLPFIAAGLLSCLVLYLYGRRSCDAWTGLWMALLLTQTGAHLYFTEARAYALILLGTAIFLLGWRRRFDERSAFTLGLMVVGCWVMTTSHVWAVAPLVAFGLAELFRWYRDKRIDWGVVAAVAIGVLPMGLFPLIRSTISETVFAQNTYRHAIGYAYWHYLGFSYVSLTAICVPIGIRRLLRGEGLMKGRMTLKSPEVVLMSALIAFPLLISILTRYEGIPFMVRYGVTTSLAFAVVGSLLVRTVVANDSQYRAYAVVVFALSLIFLTRFPRAADRVYYEEWYPENSVIAEDDLPIVVTDGFEFLQTAFYAPPELRSRLRVVLDSQRSIEFLAGAEYLGITENLLTYEELVELDSPYWLVAYPNWLHKTQWYAGVSDESSNSLVYLVNPSN